jgi:drug/metabolite transporter (DMT)-like permease
MPSAEPMRATTPPMAAPRSALLPFLLLTLAAFFWAGNWVVGRALREAMPPVALSFWRWSVAALILAPFVLPRLVGRRHLVLHHWRILLLLGLLGAALFQVLIYFGLARTTTVNAVLMNGSVPLFILLSSWAIEGERASPRQIAGILISFVGIVIIMLRGDPAALLELRFSAGDAIVLAAMPVWGVYSVMLKRRPRDLDGVELLFIMAVISAAGLSPFLAAEHLLGRTGTLSWESAGAVLYVALFASVLGYICWNRGVLALGASRAGFTAHLIPAFGTLLAILLLGESFRLFHLAGFAAILAGVTLATTGGAQRRRATS